MKYLGFSILLVTHFLFAANNNKKRYSITPGYPLSSAYIPLPSRHDIGTAKLGSLYQIEETRNNVEELAKEVKGMKKDVTEIKEDLKDFMTQTTASLNLIMETLKTAKA